MARAAVNTRTSAVKIENRAIEKITTVTARMGAMTGAMKRKIRMIESIASPFRAAEVQIAILSEGCVWVFVENSLEVQFSGLFL